MENEKNEPKKMVLGLLLGGLLGVSALYLYTTQHQKVPVLKKVGRRLSEMGEMLENCHFGSFSDMTHNIEKKLPTPRDVVNDVADWVDIGMSLWKKLKKGH